jgi:hypothetical protein
MCENASALCVDTQKARNYRQCSMESNCFKKMGQKGCLLATWNRLPTRIAYLKKSGMTDRTESGAVAVRYNRAFDFAKEFTMEAERLNSLSNLLADLTQRESELRRYL